MVRAWIPAEEVGPLMATVNSPEDLWEFIEDHARRKGREPEDLLAKILEDYRRHETVDRATSLALKGYGVRPEESKRREPPCKS